MPSPQEKLAESLDVLARLQEGGQRVFASSQMTRTHRERLQRAGFLMPVIKGWWMVADPGARPGDTTAWHASFWEFCGRYCDSRFGERWHLSPELSLLLHAEVVQIPRQVVIHTPAGQNNVVELVFGTSLFDYAAPSLPDPGSIEVRAGVRMLDVPTALVRVPPAFFRRHAVEAQVILGSIREPSELLTHLLEGDHTTVAGRLAGAFRRVGRTDAADEIVDAMTRAGHRIRESDPFEDLGELPEIEPRTPVLVGRMRGMWSAMRERVIDLFPAPALREASLEAYHRMMTDNYERDAYHSLSIEGYRVTPELIERVRGGGWNPEEDPEHARDRDALGARGYWLAFQEVRESVGSILKREGAPASIVRTAHRSWYRALFEPAVGAGFLAAADLAGYRTRPVYIQASRHVPPSPERVRDAMPALFDLLEEELEASVRAVLGHWMLGYVHPFPDGNGRVARFLMNAMLASGGYPWTVIHLEDRDDYMAALEAASVDQEIEPFAVFVADAVRRASG